MKLKAVFLDKDGTIIPHGADNVDTSVDASKITLNEDVVEGLQLLQSNGYLLVVVSNKSGVAYGYISQDDLQKVNQTINSMCSRLGIYLDGFYYCPRHPEGPCECHKPEPDLLMKAAGDMDIDLSSSWMIGDILNDVEAGNKAGCKTILIDHGNIPEWESGASRVPQYQAKGLAEAARYIVTSSNYA